MFLTVVLCAASAASLAAQEDSPKSDDVERMVRAGMVDALQSRFRGGRTPEELQLLALAQANKATRTTDDRQRQRAFKDAEARYLTWISSIERDREAEALQRAVDAIAARAACAGMILSQWAAVDLDEFELAAGKRGQTKRLIELLLKARKLYEQAEGVIEPLADELLTGDPDVEDRYLALGVYDTIPRLQLDISFNLAWTNLYLGIVDPKNASRRAAGLRAAERAFQDLVDSDQSGETAARCLLGLAMTLREQGRYDDAVRHFKFALDETASTALAAQIRYERARSEISSGRFEEARVTLRPLLEKDPDQLAPSDQPARFYINLAHLWEANGYLEEANLLEKTAAKSSAEKAIRLRAKRARESGLRKLNRLTSRGGPWPALVQLFVSDTIDPSADAKTMSAAELLFSARRHSEKKKYRLALVQLKEAASREKTAPDFATEILFELATCHYRCRENRRAAELFERLAREHKSHHKAAQAVSYAYQLWAHIAEETKRREDYIHLADVLLSLLQSFPEHEKHAEARWWLPVALQAGGRYREAIEHFGNLPADSPHYEEARYRRVVCRRLLLGAERSSLTASQLRVRAAAVANELAAYADQAFHRADAAPEPSVVREWSAAALVSAAEVQASPGVALYKLALDLLDDLELHYAGSSQIGRALAVRIDAHRALGQYEEAATVVEQFLRAVSPDQAGGTLATVARSMQEEVHRLERDGDHESARKLALQALPIFEQLETWVRADRSRADHLEAVWYGLAWMRYLAGQHEAARELTLELLAQDERDGSYQRLSALVLTASLSEGVSADRITEARAAWGALLRDPGLRSAAPEHYWEARYRYLALTLRLGEASTVRNAISQDRVWYPDLGGAGWKEKLDELYDRAVGQIRERSAASQPATAQPLVP